MPVPKTQPCQEANMSCLLYNMFYNITLSILPQLRNAIIMHVSLHSTCASYVFKPRIPRNMINSNLFVFQPNFPVSSRPKEALPQIRPWQLHATLFVCMWHLNWRVQSPAVVKKPVVGSRTPVTIRTAYVPLHSMQVKLMKPGHANSTCIYAYAMLICLEQYWRN